METHGVKWTDVAQVIVTFFGFLVVIWQMGLLRRSTAGNTYASLYGEYMDVCKLFLEKPRLRPYFYNSVAVSADIPASDPIRQEIETMCELMTGLLEHAALQEMNIPGDIWAECWKEYTSARFEESPALASYWQRKYHLYAKKFRELAPAIKEGAGTSSN